MVALPCSWVLTSKNEVGVWSDRHAKAQTGHLQFTDSAALQLHGKRTIAVVHGEPVRAVIGCKHVRRLSQASTRSAVKLNAACV